MGGVSLLTREGEVVIAKKIEAGELEIENEVYRCPVALEYVVDVAEQLKDGQVRLRDLFGDDDSSSETESDDSEESENENEEGTEEKKEEEPAPVQPSVDEEEVKKGLRRRS